MDLHVRPNASGTGYVAYDDNEHSAGGLTDNDAILAFHERWPDVELAQVDLASEPVDMIGTPDEQAKHQALLDGLGPIDHSHGDFSTCMQYIRSLAGRIQAMEDMFAGSSEPAPHEGASAEMVAEYPRVEAELGVLKRSLSSDWRNFVFQPSHSEVMLLGLIPLLRSLVLLGPNEQTVAAIGAWFESIAAERDTLITIASYLLNEIDNLPPEVGQAVRHLYEPS